MTKPNHTTVYAAVTAAVKAKNPEVQVSWSGIMGAFYFPGHR
jgi:hypothetical protein